MREQSAFGDRKHSIQVGTLRRCYDVHVPPAFDGLTRLPLVLALHSWRGNAGMLKAETNLSQKADVSGFVVAYPEGSRVDMQQPFDLDTNRQTWNDGSGRFHSGLRGVDDVGFIRALLDRMRGEYAIDLDRVYATGFGNGACMVYRLGIELADHIAAIAPVSGHLWYRGFKLSRPVPMLFIIGNDDPINPPAGGVVRGISGNYEERPSILEEVPRWAHALGCAATPETVYDQNGVTAVGYRGGKPGVEVLFYRVDGLGNVWPGGRSMLPENLVGAPSGRLIANDVIWDFFQQHPMA